MNKHEQRHTCTKGKDLWPGFGVRDERGKLETWEQLSSEPQREMCSKRSNGDPVDKGRLSWGSRQLVGSRSGGRSGTGRAGCQPGAGGCNAGVCRGHCSSLSPGSWPPPSVFQPPSSTVSLCHHVHLLGQLLRSRNDLTEWRALGGRLHRKVTETQVHWSLR